MALIAPIMIALARLRGLQTRACHWFAASSALLLYVPSLSIADPAKSIGVYTGSFDPPTRAHEQLVRRAASFPGVDHLVVLVNADGTKAFKSSVEERIEMLKLGLADLKDKVEFRSVTGTERDAYFAQLGHDPDQKVYRFAGQDSYNKVPKQDKARINNEWVVIQRSGADRITEMGPHVHFLNADAVEGAGISSTLTRKTIAEKGDLENLLSPPVSEYIRKNHLYEILPGEWGELQKRLHLEAFRQFIDDLSPKFPQIDWSGIAAPPFEPQQSPRGRLDAFLRQIIETRGLTGELRENLEKQGRRMFLGNYKDQKFAALPSIGHQPENFLPAPTAKIRNIEKFQTAPSLPSSDAALNTDHYIEQRIPKEVQNFLTDHHGTAWLHQGSLNEAMARHQKDGYTEMYPFSTRRHAGNYWLTRNPKNGNVRLVVAELTGQDRIEQITSQLKALPRPIPYEIAEHRSAFSAFVPNSVAKAIKLNSNDEVILGFAGTVNKTLSKDGHWTKTNLTQQGLIADLWVEESTGRRIVLAQNAHGEEIQEFLKYFYKKGARKFTVMGTAGSVSPNIAVGDLLIPSEIQTKSGEIIQLKNRFQSLALSPSSSGIIHHNTRHGWVPSVLSETRSGLKKMSESGIKSIDIEGQYLAEFASHHPDAKTGLLFWVSDQPLGTTTYDQQFTVIDKIQNSVSQVVHETFGNTVAAQLPCEALYRAPLPAH